MKTQSSTWWAALAPVVLISTGGLVPQLASGEDAKGTVTAVLVTAMAEGREIRASAGGGAIINTSGANATVKVGNHVLKVEKTRLQLDDQMPSDIPAATRLVDIQVVEEMLTVKADGKEVLRAKMK